MEPFYLRLSCLKTLSLLDHIHMIKGFKHVTSDKPLFEFVQPAIWVFGRCSPVCMLAPGREMTWATRTVRTWDELGLMRSLEQPRSMLKDIDCHTHTHEKFIGWRLTVLLVRTSSTKDVTWGGVGGCVPSNRDSNVQFSNRLL
eukprot:2758992-Amphidinium_carterae.1